MIFIKVLKADEVSFSVVGDIMNHQTQINTAYDKKCDCWDYRFSFEKVKPYLRQTDITIGNLETTLPGNRKLFSGYPQFGAPDELIDALKDAGFNVLTLANNHSVDKGYNAFLRTRYIVSTKGIIPLGTFYNYQDYEQNKITIITKNNIRLAFLNYSYGTNGIPIPLPAKMDIIDFRLMHRDIEKAKEYLPDLIILLLHYGTEYLTEPDNFQRYIVNFALKEGVDIILGGHPHVLQKFEKIILTDKYGNTKERLIVWSLGNFISHQKRRNTYGGIIFQFKIRKENHIIKISEEDYIPVFVQFKGKHFILPIHEYLYLSDTGNTSHFFINVFNNYYNVHFLKEKNEELQKIDKLRMITFLQDSLEILKIFPKKLIIK